MGAGGTHPHGHDADEIHAAGAEALLHQRNAVIHAPHAPPSAAIYIYGVGTAAPEGRLESCGCEESTTAGSIVRNTRTRHSHANIIGKRRAA